MKRIIGYASAILIAVIVVWSCSKRNLSPNGTDGLASLPAVDKAALTDSTLSNNEMWGRMMYTHMKYYLNTVDPTASLSASERKEITDVMAECHRRIQNGMTYDVMVDEMVANGKVTENVGINMKAYQHAILDYVNNNPDADSKAIWNFCLSEEKKVRTNNTLTYDEKNTLLLNHTLIRNALKYRAEQLDFNRIKKAAVIGTNGDHNRIYQTNSFWSSLACFLGTITEYAGYAIGAFVSNKVLGAVLGAAAHYITSTFNCDNSNTNVCQDPLSVSFPYACYTTGDPLVCTAEGYGNITPSQFVFDFRYNDNLNNLLYSNFTSSNSITLPGSYITNSGAYDVAVQCQTSCSSGNPLWFGWFTLADLGKPLFAITGNGNFTVADASYYPSFQYWADGTYPNASIQWQIIPSGYPNYSATGTILSGATGYVCGIKWDAHAGFATLKCTMTTSCATVVQYFSIHIN